MCPQQLQEYKEHTAAKKVFSYSQLHAPNTNYLVGYHEDDNGE